jgi:hypothetical protein
MPRAAMKRMALEELGPSQMYAIQTRKHRDAWRARPGIIEIRWCPAHKGVPRNEKADECAKLAADKPDYHGGNGAIRRLVHLKREISEMKWQEAKMWADSRVTQKKYRHRRQGKALQKPVRAPAKSNKRLAGRFYRLKTGHCLTGQYLKWTRADPQPSVGGARNGPRHGSISSSAARTGSARRRFCGLR